MFKEKMTTPAIPERVFALCKLAEKGTCSSAELRQKMEPDFLENGSVYFNEYKIAAEELGLISISDDYISLAVEPIIVKDIESMRRYINSRLELLKEGQFYKVTKAYFGKGSDILRGDKNIANLGPAFAEIIGMPVDAPAMRAWRFWAAFLGFGYLHDMFVIPNASVFLKDVISYSSLERNHLYTVSEFIKALTPMCNIIISNTSTKTLSYGVSNGLRSLQETKFLKLEHIHDQEDMWTLYPLKAYSNDSTITHITIM